MSAGEYPMIRYELDKNQCPIDGFAISLQLLMSWNNLKLDEIQATDGTVQPAPQFLDSTALSVASQFNLVDQLPRLPFLLDLHVPALAPQIDGIVPAFGEPVLPLPVVRDHGTIHGATVVLGDGPNDHSVGAGRAPVVRLAGHDGELEVGLHGVLEGEVLVVVVGVGVFVAA